MAVSIRKVEREVGETNSAGGATRIEVSYELGGEIGGTWIPFATLTEGRVDDLTQRAERDAEREKASKAAGKSGNGK